jgi:uncharacterized repeat protein (TIGR03803 family)
VQATDGNFYGTTYEGANDGGAYAANGSGGTVFEITASGQLTTLYRFCTETDCTDGANPIAGLVQAADGNFYGITSFGGTNPNCAELGPPGCGTVFEMTPGGTLTTLYSFCSKTGCTDGAEPVQLMQATDGNFYGTTEFGGAQNNGTAFVLSLSLGPFAETVPTSGKLGEAVKILGTNLKGTTSVTFNGSPATFKVVSSTEIAATVPSGATTGPIEVKTPSGTLTSNVNFQVS